MNQEPDDGEDIPTVSKDPPKARETQQIPANSSLDAGVNETELVTIPLESRDSTTPEPVQEKRVVVPPAEPEVRIETREVIVYVEKPPSPRVTFSELSNLISEAKFEKVENKVAKTKPLIYLRIALSTPSTLKLALAVAETLFPREPERAFDIAAEGGSVTVYVPLLTLMTRIRDLFPEVDVRQYVKGLQARYS